MYDFSVGLVKLYIKRFTFCFYDNVIVMSSVMLKIINGTINYGVCINRRFE